MPCGKTFCAHIKESVSSLFVIVLMPLIYVALEFAALYGVLAPYGGRKLYGTLERLAGEKGFLAPCFQPEPTHHLFGGDLMDPYAI